MSHKIGIIVSGGPAPGINSVISSAVITARKLGSEVVGFLGGFQGAVEHSDRSVVPLPLSDVTRVYKTGGSIIGTSRFNPFKSKESTERFKQTLKDHGIDQLVVIGGEGSAYISYLISKEIPYVQIVHVPKTIDNDLLLPHEMPSFGFETARSAGTHIVDTLMIDAKTCERWFLVSTMGRNAGFLALGLGIASRATTTLIPEEFLGKSPTLTSIADILLGSIKARLADGKPYGVALIAEGVLDTIDSSSTPLLATCPRDELGRIKHSEIEVGEIILSELRALCKKEKLSVAFNTKNIGYELRCHDPVSYDIEYTTILGFGAIELLRKGQSGVMVIREFDSIGSVPLSDMALPSGGIRSRKVDLDSDLYRVARSFMIR